MIFVSLLFQCLVNVLKSLVEWEKSHQELDKNGKSSQSAGGEASESVEVKNKENVTINFEKAKAHKSTLEAVISEVVNQ